MRVEGLPLRHRLTDALGCATQELADVGRAVTAVSVEQGHSALLVPLVLECFVQEDARLIVLDFQQRERLRKEAAVHQ